MEHFTVNIPEYNLEQDPDFLTIGTKIETILKKHFSGKRLAVRGVSLQDHPNKSLSWLRRQIETLGTDRYDPNRKGVHEALDKRFGIELHAVPMMPKEKILCPHYRTDHCEVGNAIGDLLSDCYGGAIIDRGYALRIDILMLYDLDQLTPAPLVWTDEGPTHTNKLISPENTCAFKFKNPKQKKEALLGTISIEKS